MRVNLHERRISLAYELVMVKDDYVSSAEFGVQCGQVAASKIAENYQRRLVCLDAFECFFVEPSFNADAKSCIQSEQCFAYDACCC